MKSTIMLGRYLFPQLRSQLQTVRGETSMLDCHTFSHLTLYKASHLQGICKCSFSSSLLISMSCLEPRGPQFYSDVYMYLGTGRVSIGNIVDTCLYLRQISAIYLISEQSIYSAPTRSTTYRYLLCPSTRQHSRFGIYIVSLFLLPHCHSCINGYLELRDENVRSYGQSKIELGEPKRYRMIEGWSQSLSFIF